MPVNVLMPQMGESVAEGTVVRWIKKVGDAVDRDEPLFEISTDKVDAEIPSPAAGTLAEIRVREGETVPVDSVVALIAKAGEAVEVGAPAAEASAVPVESDTAGPGGEPVPSALEPTAGEVKRTRSSPLVRRIAKDHGVDVSNVTGTGIGGRVTKHDILAFIADREAAPRPSAAPPPATARAEAPPPAPVFKPGDRVQVVPMSVMRKKIAEHMVASRRTSAHVHSVFEFDYTRVARIRETRKAEFERQGAKLTFMAFIAKAVCDALKATPVVNASIDGENIVYKQDVNLGIAVALDWGLIVPVVRNADEKNLLGLSRAIADVASRARSKQLKPEDVQGGTFTITNPGVFGTLFGMPIISQPQVAILGVGAIEKRVVVIDDAIAARQRGYMTLGYDHRLVDGAVADEFMSHVKRSIENWDPNAV